MPETTLALLFGINAVIISLAALYIGLAELKHKIAAEKYPATDFELKLLRKMVLNPKCIPNRKKLEFLAAGYEGRVLYTT